MNSQNTNIFANRDKETYNKKLFLWIEQIFIKSRKMTYFRTNIHFE